MASIRHCCAIFNVFLSLLFHELDETLNEIKASLSTSFYHFFESLIHFPSENYHTSSGNHETLNVSKDIGLGIKIQSLKIQDVAIFCEKLTYSKTTFTKTNKKLGIPLGG